MHHQLVLTPNQSYAIRVHTNIDKHTKYSNPVGNIMIIYVYTCTIYIWRLVELHVHVADLLDV